MVNTLKSIKNVSVMVSEEEPECIIVGNDGKYVLAFDPLDGSSNIDCNVSIGTIFGVWKKTEGQEATKKTALQVGDKQIASGYCCYGSATQLVLCAGGEVNGFTLDPSLGEFILTHPDIKIPDSGAIYSINEGNAQHWHEPITKYVQTRKFPEEGKKVHSLRYVGSMVADVHRTLLYGGVFLYPADKKSKSGKLRLLYEAAPMSMVIETAGGMAIDGRKRIMEVEPTDIHQRCGVIMGSKVQVQEIKELYEKMDKENAN